VQSALGAQTGVPQLTLDEALTALYHLTFKSPHCSIINRLRDGDRRRPCATSGKKSVTRIDDRRIAPLRRRNTSKA
jgi:hypothetical protein